MRLKFSSLLNSQFATYILHNPTPLIANYYPIYVYRQLTISPCLIVGDFNAYSLQWGSASTDSRELIIEAFLSENYFNILNNGSPARIADNNETAIDLSLRSPSISLSFDWSVFKSPLDREHCPIIIETQDSPPEPHLLSWNLKQADWHKFSSSTAWQNLPSVDINNVNLISDLYEQFFLACEESIPKCLPSKFYPTVMEQ